MAPHLRRRVRAAQSATDSERLGRRSTARRRSGDRRPHEHGHLGARCAIGERDNRSDGERPQPDPRTDGLERRLRCCGCARGGRRSARDGHVRLPPVSRGSKRHHRTAPDARLGEPSRHHPTRPDPGCGRPDVAGYPDAGAPTRCDRRTGLARSTHPARTAPRSYVHRRSARAARRGAPSVARRGRQNPRAISARRNRPNDARQDASGGNRTGRGLDAEGSVLQRDRRRVRGDTTPRQGRR